MMAHCLRQSLLISFSIRAGRIPFEFEQLLLFQSPLEFTIKAFCEPLLELQYGERSHQLVAEMSRTLISGGCLRRISYFLAFT